MTENVFSSKWMNSDSPSVRHVKKQVMPLFVICHIFWVLSKAFSRPHSYVLPEAQQHSKVTPIWLFIDFQLSLFQAELTK